MKRPGSKPVMGTLVLVNVILLGTLAWRVSTDTPAEAQTRRPGEYLMVDGEASGASVDVIYVLDVANGELGAIAPNNQDKLSSIPVINLNQIFDAAMQANQPAAPAGRRRSN